jgi:hypothetical protein
MVVGTSRSINPWESLDRAIELLYHLDKSQLFRSIEKDCADAMIAQGVEPQWVFSDYDNIDELLWYNYDGGSFYN